MARSIENDLVLLIVADGVGGAGGGEIASAETVNTVVSALVGQAIEEPGPTLLQAVTVANARVRELGKSDPQLSGMATTVVAAIIAKNVAWIVSLGDSRAYILRGGEIEAITEDDSWVAEQVRAGILSVEDAAKSPYQNVITRGVGVEERVRVEEATRFELRGNDVLFLCSDGLYRCVTPETIADTLADRDIERAAARLIELANNAGGPDNISVAIYRHPLDASEEPTIAS